MAIEDKLYQVRFNIDAIPHIKVATDICESCSDKPCLYVCPVQNYTLQDGKLSFIWQGCVECGACRIVCPLGAIQWDYPRGGYGVHLRYG
ncbi:ferredoxin family protein [Chloroflexota bacterium]